MHTSKKLPQMQLPILKIVKASSPPLIIILWDMHPVDYLTLSRVCCRNLSVKEIKKIRVQMAAISRLLAVLLFSAAIASPVTGSRFFPNVQKMPNPSLKDMQVWTLHLAPFSLHRCYRTF